MSARPVEACRVCGASRFAPVIDLGPMPLANSFLPREALERPEPRYPLTVIRCVDCGLVGLSVVVDPAEMFQTYLYVSGTSDTMRRHFAESAAEITRRFLHDESLVVEIGSNDGTLLGAFPRGVRVLGIEPARNIAEIARGRGVPTEAEFFSAALAADVERRHGPADAMLGNNVVAHIDDLTDLMTGAGALLGPEGVFVFEVPGLLDLIERNAFDTVYHEHLSYFSLHTLARLAGRHGMAVFDVERLGVHGGSMRVFVDRARRSRSPAVEEMLAREDTARLGVPATYDAFAARVEHIRGSFRALIETELAAGRRCAGYGAPAKGNTLLCASGIEPRHLAFIADKNPLKQGLFTPGTHIEVASPERIERDRPDTLVILAWNFADEIRSQQRAHAERGGRFMVPIPEPRVTDGAGAHV